MKKAIVVCWIGKLPDYFRFWYESCKNNKDFTFFIFTDQPIRYKAANIIVKKITLEEINKKLSASLGLQCNITSSYKLCDIRPFYGVLFKEYLSSYDYWGHCDIDMVFGDLSSFVKDALIKNYKKINVCGHFVLYKNSEQINHMYMRPGSVFDYKTVACSAENYAFDEYHGSDRIFRKNNIKTLNLNYYADIDPKHARFIELDEKNYKQQFYVYDNKKLFRYALDNGRILKTEKMYLHFQKKKPLVKTTNYESFVISSDGFTKIDDYKSMFDEINKYNGMVYERFENIKYVFGKCVCFMKDPFIRKKIKLKHLFARVIK